jgi:hypothetical protein
MFKMSFQDNIHTDSHTYIHTPACCAHYASSRQQQLMFKMSFEHHEQQPLYFGSGAGSESSSGIPDPYGGTHVEYSNGLDGGGDKGSSNKKGGNDPWVNGYLGLHQIEAGNDDSVAHWLRTWRREAESLVSSGPRRTTLLEMPEPEQRFVNTEIPEV